MDILIVEIINAAFAVLLLAWLLIDILKQSRGGGGDLHRRAHEAVKKQPTVLFTTVTVLSNIVISILYLGFGFYQYWDLGIVTSKSVFLSVTWILATVVVCYSRNRFLGENNRWPIVVILWWIFYSIFCSLSVSIHFITRFSSIELPYSWPEANIADFPSLPLSILLCLNALTFRCSSNKTQDGLDTPLLQEEHGSSFGDSACYRNAGFWSKLTFRWLNPLFSSGRMGKLELSHVPSVPASETAEYASSLLEDSFGKEKNETSNLPKAIANAVWKALAINGVFAGANTIASYMGPLLITYFTVESLTQRHWYFGAQRIGVRVRAALSALVYKKSLSVKFAGSSKGKIINMINVDVERIGDFCWNIHGVWLLPFQVFLALVILYRNLGAAPSIAALSSTILVMVSNTPLASKQERLHSRIMEAKDSRIKATSETLKSMRVLKLYSWEQTFLKKLLQLRETERIWLGRYLYTSSAIAFLFWASPTLVSAITFGVCIILKTPLTTGTVLSALATFRILQEPIYNLPELISMIAQTKVSIDRIQDFLREKDQKKQTPRQTSAASDIAIEINSGEYAWEKNDQNSTKPAIKITKNMKIMKLCKVAVCGSVGSGKSSLLHSIIGEIPRISGAGIKVHGTKAYVPQSAWIQTRTVRDNVLFGKDMNKGFYAEVLEGCALNPDIEQWSDGDLTVVGERGVNLSGGQKQRIQLARAVYSNSDVYILDDPFSAVDAHTATHLFKKCLMQLLSKKTVIYATHQLEFLEAADLVLVMKDGMIVQSGTYKDLIADPTGELVGQMVAHRRSLNQVNPPQEDNSLTRVPSQLNQIEVTEEKF
ncbi:hypothetical protein OIU79_006989 [Salix purpurea]|uniref:ABC-type xenobiotic transporter n=1 Tax=Salix purpurea TaxID=77065 RepID=A0A9Q0TWQ9_SALPP|nr:hypothetical protein OIU79_006989 [Salix purpurea]